MIKVQLQIGDGAIYDTFDKYGFIYMSADTVFAPPVKEFERTQYPEEDGEHIHPSLLYEPFDYNVKFFISATQGIGNANQKIADFNKQLYNINTNGIRMLKKVTFYNDYKKVKIVGYAKPIKDATEFWRDNEGKQFDIVCVEWKIRVTNPSECDFNLLT
jgi:hypothetical protein